MQHSHSKCLTGIGITQFLPGVLFAILGLRVSPSAVGAGIGVTAFLMEKSLPYGLFAPPLTLD